MPFVREFRREGDWNPLILANGQAVLDFSRTEIAASIKELSAEFLCLQSKSSDSYLSRSFALKRSHTTCPGGSVVKAQPIVLSGIGAADFGDWSLRFGSDHDKLWVAAKANGQRHVIDRFASGEWVVVTT